MAYSYPTTISYRTQTQLQYKPPIQQLKGAARGRGNWGGDDHFNPSSTDGDKSPFRNLLFDFIIKKWIILFQPFPLLSLRTRESMLLIPFHQIHLCGPTPRHFPFRLIKRPQPRCINMTMSNPRHQNSLIPVHVIHLIAVNPLLNTPLGRGRRGRGTGVPYVSRRVSRGTFVRLSDKHR